MSETTGKVVCARCGKAIIGYGAWMKMEYVCMDSRTKEGEFVDTRNKDFCRECAGEIIDFALNKDTCDECIREMEETAALLRAADEEEVISPNMEKYKDVMATYLGEPVKRNLCAADENGESGGWNKLDTNAILQAKPCIKYMIPTEIIAEAMKNIRKEALNTSGKPVIPFQDVDTKLIDKFQSRFKGIQ